jgi:cytochrome c oxidase subunit III
MKPTQGSLLRDPDGLSTAQLAMYVGLGSMTMLFGASLVGYFVTRAQAKAWRSVDLPQLPWGIWLSTAVLVSLSFALHRAERSVAANKSNALIRSLFAAMILAGLFCLSQAENWRQVAHTALSVEEKGLYIYSFFMLTVLHVLHVVAGLVPLWITHHRASKQLYSSSRREGIHLLRQYWDFLLVVWLVLLAALHFS